MLSPRSIALATLIAGAISTTAHAQQIERPVPFDSAGRVRSITPQLVARYGLAAPEWPVTGSFVAARLFATESGALMLSVERSDGVIERHAMSAEDARALRGAIDTALARVEVAPPGRLADIASPPARGGFARNQLLLSLVLYGPLLASLPADGQTATAMYLLGAGGSYFLAMNLSRTLQVTRAQNHLATDGAIRGYGAAAAFIYLSGARPGHRTYSALGLGGALGGSIFGYQRGKGLTDAEAQAATTISTLGAAAGFGAAATLSSIDNSDSRLQVGAMLGAGLVGYGLGPNYARRPSYTVTRGDVQMLFLGSMLGAAAGFTPVAGTRNDQAAFGMLTAGMLAGAYVADRALVRPFDYGASEAGQVRLATTAGALMGTAVAVLVDPGAEGLMGMVTTGALLGAIAGHALADPHRAGESSSRDSGSRIGSYFDVNPAALALAAARKPGHDTLVSVRF